MPDFSDYGHRLLLLRQLPVRVSLLLGAEWARAAMSFRPQFPDVRSLMALEISEAFIARPTNLRALTAMYAGDASNDAAQEYYNAALSCNSLDGHLASAATCVAQGVVALSAVSQFIACCGAFVHAAARCCTSYPVIGSWPWLHETWEHAYGPPGLRFEPAWKTSTAIQLARGIRDDRALDRLPILADALMDAGMDHARLGEHLQTDKGEWTQAEWVLWNLLGYGE